MINIVLKGVDEFLGSHVDEVVSPQVAKILNVSSDEVVVTCLHSIIYHNGVDQTSYHMIVNVELEEKYRSEEEKLAEYILSVSKNFAVHCQVSFSYSNGKVYSRIDEEYPLFVTNSNEVVIEDNEDESQEVYLGDMFANFEEQLKNSKK